MKNTLRIYQDYDIMTEVKIMSFDYIMFKFNLTTEGLTPSAGCLKNP